MKITTVYMRILIPPSKKNTHLTPKVKWLDSNRPSTRQQKRKRKSNRGRRKGKSDGVMVMERVIYKFQLTQLSDHVPESNVRKRLCLSFEILLTRFALLHDKSHCIRKGKERYSTYHSHQTKYVHPQS
ncbi:hypothetical protein MTR_8g079478 [Medicago truncatula]|uniref:Uncharacterized protein n=1 Tax=Medicago truncatula TaxID=3880 RepID=A0A072TTL2_MEDTR|nr:hypothetical protein MTR_8g079478 [Medicago truncatula]